MARTPDEVLSELLSLNPPGWLWEGMAQPTSNWALFLGPLAASLAQAEADAEAQGVEIDPLTSGPMLPDWERLLGLPDPCAGIAPSVAARQAQARARLTDRGSTSVAGLQAYALALGFTLQISTFRPLYVGLGTCMDTLYDDDWAYSWMITDIVDVLSADGSITADRKATLLCEFERIKPFDTDVLWGDPPTTTLDFSSDLEAMVAG